MKGLNHRVFIPVMDSDRVVEMIHWCYTNVDANNLNWEWSYDDDSDLNSDVNFYFRDPRMATLFTLRWR